MICALPTASFNLTVPSSGRTSTGATSRLAPMYVAPKKTIATFAGGSPAPTPDAVSAADLAPPVIQNYPVQGAAPASGMSMTTKVAIFGVVALAAGVAIIVATKR